MKINVGVLLICLSLAACLAVSPFNSGFCACANLDQPCSHDDDKNSSIPKCCPRDRDTSVLIKCDVKVVGEIGTCIKKEEK